MNEYTEKIVFIIIFSLFKLREVKLSFQIFVILHVYPLVVLHMQF